MNPANLSLVSPPVSHRYSKHSVSLGKQASEIHFAARRSQNNNRRNPNPAPWYQKLILPVLLSLPFIGGIAHHNKINEKPADPTAERKVFATIPGTYWNPWGADSICESLGKTGHAEIVEGHTVPRDNLESGPKQDLGVYEDVLAKPTGRKDRYGQEIYECEGKRTGRLENF